MELASVEIPYANTYILQNITYMSLHVSLASDCNFENYNISSFTFCINNNLYCDLFKWCINPLVQSFYDKKSVNPPQIATEFILSINGSEIYLE